MSKSGHLFKQLQANAGTASKCILIAFCTCLMTLFTYPLSAATGTDTKTKSVIEFSCLAPPGSRYFIRLEKLYRESFKELGYDFKMTALSEPEILDSFAQQRFDGDCARIEKYFSAYSSDNYELLGTSTFNMKINIYGRRKLEKLELSQLNVAAQPFSEFMPRLAEQYGIRIEHELSSPDEAWPLLQNGKINGYMGIAYLFPKDSPAVRNLDIGPEYTLSRYPVYAALHTRHSRMKKPLERVLLRRIRSSARPGTNKDKPHSERTRSSPSSMNIVFSCPVSPDTGVFSNLVEFYSRAFHRMGYRFEMIGMSRDREAHELLHNKVDGSCGRINIPETETNKPIRLPITISEDDFEVWSKQKGPLIRSLSDIPPGSKVAYRQSLLTDKEIAAAPHIHFIPKKLVEEALESLNSGQADYTVDLQIQVDTSINNLSLMEPIYYRGRIGRVTVSPYLSEKRRKLRHPLTRELRSLLGGDKSWSEVIYPKSQRK